jgi:hypothetical protein
VGTFICWDFFTPLTEKFNHLQATLPRLTALEIAIEMMDNAFIHNHPEYEGKMGKVSCY